MWEKVVAPKGEQVVETTLLIIKVTPLVGSWETFKGGHVGGLFFQTPRDSHSASLSRQNDVVQSTVLYLILLTWSHLLILTSSLDRVSTNFLLR